MKFVAIAVAGLLGLAALQPAQAQFAVPGGPFADKQALVNWWNANNTQSAITQVFHNGKLVYSRSGFGPALVVKYYGCAITSDVRRQCGNKVDGASALGELIDRIDTNSGAHPAIANIDVYLDGALYRPYTVAPKQFAYYVLTCKGDPSYYEPAGNKYYVVRGWAPPISPVYMGRCY